MQTRRMPLSVCEELDRQSRAFIWGESEGKRKVHLVSWDDIFKPKDQGGLGFRKRAEMNKASLVGWRFFMEKDRLWTIVLHNKYPMPSRGVQLEKPTQGASYVWKGIVNSWNEVNEAVKWVVGNGKLARFWLDRWIMDKPLLEYAFGPVDQAKLQAKIADL